MDPHIRIQEPTHKDLSLWGCTHKDLLICRDPHIKIYSLEGIHENRFCKDAHIRIYSLGGGTHKDLLCTDPHIKIYSLGKAHRWIYYVWVPTY